MDAHVLPIQLESTWYFIEAHHVCEVLGEEPWLPIPRSRAGLPGVIVWRGRAVPLVDLGTLLGVAKGAVQSRPRTLIVRHERGVAALPVDAAREVRRIAGEALKAVQGGLLPYGTRELDEQGEIVTLIDLEALLSDLDRASGASGNAG